MASLVHQRCFHHAAREAAGRCPECAKFYCRECITEHEDRIICATCLAKLTQKRTTGRSIALWFWSALQLTGGVFVAWLFFYFVGQVLLLIPSAFHEGALWYNPWWQQ